MRQRIKEICDYVSRGSTPDYVDSSPYKVMNQATFSKGFLDESNVRFTSKPVIGAHIKRGDLLMASTGGGVLGKLFYYDSTDDGFFADSHVSILRNSKGENHMKYLYYYFYNRYDEINSTMVKGSTNQTELQRDYLLSYEIEIPSFDMQHRIVDYLDAKLSEIDKRVSVLEKQRDAYMRLKKSMIHQVVTRGLNPDVPLKDSEVEWIGMIPERWEVKRIKDLFPKYTTGLTPESKVEENFSDDGRYTWITIGDMTNKVVNESFMCLSDKVIKEKTPVLSPKGSLLFSFKLSIGKTAFAGKDLYTNEAIVTIPPNNKYELKYFYYLIPYICLNNATENIYGAKMLNQRIIANMLLAIPPLQEQQAIASYLDDKCAKIDAAIENIGKQIDASKRLKRAIINEAISGKTIL